MQEIGEDDAQGGRQVSGEIPVPAGGLDVSRLQQPDPDDDERAGNCRGGGPFDQPCERRVNRKSQTPCVIAEARVFARPR